MFDIFSEMMALATRQSRWDAPQQRHRDCEMPPYDFRFLPERRSPADCRE